MPNNVQVNADAFKARLIAEIGRRLDRAAVLVQNHAKELLSVEGTGQRVITMTDRRGRKRKRKKLIYGANPSRPGEPPRLQTGRLRASVATARTGLVARVGTGLLYGRHLEFGTSRMAPRPWLRRSLLEMSDQIRAEIGRPLK